MVILNEFKDRNEPISWGAADTEAYTYIDGVKLSTEEVEKLGKDPAHTVAWFHKHAKAVVYAWLFSDGSRLFWSDDFDSFADFCAQHRINAVWWYNAKYDFSHIDYAILSAGWDLNPGGNDSKGQPNTYKSLHGDCGARYSYKLWRQYTDKNYHKKTHTTTHYDFCNIFGGGLAKCLSGFDVQYPDGRKIRKLTMDYQGASDPEAQKAYMRVDVDGLYHLVRIASDFCHENYNISLAGDKPDVITAGGMAKRVLLNTIYKEDNPRDNLRVYQRTHRMDAALDRWTRERYLYRGGICFVNPRYQNILLHTTIHKYDFNSHYPAQMAKMPDFIGRPREITLEQWDNLTKKDYIAIYKITYLRGRLKKGMVAVWYDPLTKEYTATPHFADERGMLIFADEFGELLNWYDLDAEISSVIILKKRKEKGWKEYVDKIYKQKADGKREKNGVKVAAAKLLLNSAYGKTAENPLKNVSHREIIDGAVRLIDDGEEVDEKSIMNVYQGALITSMARVGLLREIRTACPCPDTDFIYCDTDSIHTIKRHPNTDPYKLGMLKDEGTYTYAKYLAPKTYFVSRETTFTENGRLYNGYDYEMHTKGVPIKCISSKMRSYMHPDFVSKNLFYAGKKFLALAGLNVPGGKVLVPVLKHLCKPDNTISRNDCGALELYVEE